MHNSPENDDSYTNEKLNTQFYIHNRDEKLVWDEFIQGDSTALSYIYRHYVDKLFNYGRQFASEQIVLDSIQDLFYDLIKSRENLSACNSVKAYLYASLRRKILRTKSKLKNEVDQSKIESETSFRIALVPDSKSIFDSKFSDQANIIQKACNSLPLRQREAILLYYFEELSYKEIISIMHLKNVSSARMLVHRALRSLRSLLKNISGEFFVILCALFSL